MTGRVVRPGPMPAPAPGAPSWPASFAELRAELAEATAELRELRRRIAECELRATAAAGDRGDFAARLAHAIAKVERFHATAEDGIDDLARTVGELKTAAVDGASLYIDILRRLEELERREPAAPRL